MNHNRSEDRTDFTASEEEIRFDPSKEQEKKTGEEVKKVKKQRKVKWYFLIPLVLLLAAAAMLIGWHFVPPTYLNVCVLDKTILTVEADNDIDIRSIYRKHQGFFWLLEQQKYVFENGSFYDTKTDYFGHMVNETGQIESNRELSSLDYSPDLMYVADVYGAVDDTYGYFDSSVAKGSGVSVDDMSVISYAYETGATVIAEMELFNSNLDSSIYSQLSSMCGVKPTGWVGRYIFDLQDFTDVPDWAPPMYEKQEGVEWQFSGPGILLVSADRIIVLEQKTDFESKNLLKIHINSDYEKEFKSCDKVNFYNWFEIVEPNSDTEVIAGFEFDVNATGMEKLKGVLKSPVFAAAMRKNAEGKAPVYYFAGDFNDYVNHENYNRFLFADTVYRWISYDRQGDISNFYWNFYNPLMKKILSDIEPRVKTDDTEGKTAPARIGENGFQIYSHGEWRDTVINAVSINASEPGEKGYSRNYSFYQSLVDEAVKIGANCIYAKDILPPEFYRAVHANNSGTNAAKIYIIQNIKLSGDSDGKYVTERIKSAVDALHGNGSVTDGDGEQKSTYFIDVSDYVLAVTAEVSQMPQDYSFSGAYAEGERETGFSAFLYDTLQSCAVDSYGYLVPVGIYEEASLIQGSGMEENGAYSLNGIVTDKACKEGYFFTCTDFEGISALMSSNESGLADKSDKYAYTFEALNKAANGRLFVCGVGVSSADGMGQRAAVTEKAQGQRTAAMLKSADSAGVLCAVAADLNDDWSAVSHEMYPFTVTLENNHLWQNTADPAQTTGFVAFDAEAPEETGINLADDDRVQMLSLSSNEGYFYITAQLLTEIDYTAEKLFIGIDTYQRNDGEYYYSKEYTPTALSGMEFVISFDDKREAALYVVSSYDRNSGSYATKESYSGAYSLVSKLTYGGFSSGDNQFYQTGSTVYIRIPWTWLNVTDPSQKIVLNNEGELSGQAKTVTTNGAVVSVLIADKQTKDQLYLFPETKQDPAYKTYKWSTWDTVSYNMREKESFALIRSYFSSK
ncbi:MAG: hypothetical protein PUC29_08585 [Clostridia bacterium]|nr:hypothetical protein [Clostridia bacterium]